MGEAGRWKPYTQRQGQLLPTSADDALEPSDPVFFIDDAVEQLDVGPLGARYAVVGEHAYDPRLLLKLWLYGATQGIYSGREIGRWCRRDLAFRYLFGDAAVPDFRTINRFRVRHRADFAWILRETLRLARAAGLGKLEPVTAGPDEVTGEHVAIENHEPRADASGGGASRGYNVQAAVSEDGLVVATAVTTAGDSGQLVSTVEAVRTTVGQRPELVVADKAT